MSFPKKVLLLAAGIGMMVPAAAAGPSQPQAVRAAVAQGPPTIAAYSIAEIASLAASEQFLPGRSVTRSEPLTPATVGAGALVTQAQRSARPIPDSGGAPAGPEPSGWMLLLSGLAVAAWIAWRRASVGLV